MALEPTEQQLRKEALQEMPELAKPLPDTAVFRRNRAKGPNPLSVRRKSSKQATAAGRDAAAPKRKRQRHRGQAEDAAVPVV